MGEIHTPENDGLLATFYAANESVAKVRDTIWPTMGDGITERKLSLVYFQLYSAQRMVDLLFADARLGSYVESATAHNECAELAVRINSAWMRDKTE